MKQISVLVCLSGLQSVNTIPVVVCVVCFSGLESLELDILIVIWFRGLQSSDTFPTMLSYRSTPNDSFYSCFATKIVATYTGGHSVVALSTPGTAYFIGKDPTACAVGLKVAIKVV